MITEIQQIAPYVAKQFPAFYNEEGANFIQFVNAYYEWLDEQGPIYKTRRLENYTDIDSTADQYITYFTNKYLNGIPTNIVANKRLLEKHILDLYRTKGSVEGIKLLFRLLYNLDANIYLPQDDILKVSDGKWIKRKFLEIEDNPNNYYYIKQQITGSTSGASAHVEDVVQINYGGKINYLFYITNIQQGPGGFDFVPDERILYSGLDIKNSSKILGSLTTADVLGSTENHYIGEVLLPTNTPYGEGAKFVVSELIDPLRTKGYITFSLKDGGEGYTLNSTVNITYLSATSGAGASFKIGSISNPKSFTYNLNQIFPVINTRLNASNFGGTLNFATLNTPLYVALTNQTTTIGTIASLINITSGDRNYNGTLKVDVTEPITSIYGIVGANGGLLGQNAIITATPSTGNGIISHVNVLASGYDYSEGDIIDVYNTDNNELNAQLQLHINGEGQEDGFWKNDDGLLNSDKYIQDSYYYQTYSYEVQIEKSLDKYFDILKKVMHPIGNKIFGKNLFIDEDDNLIEDTYDAIEIYQNGLPWSGGTLVLTV